MTLRVLVLGAGATGGYFGGRLVEAAAAGKADVDVTFLVRPARAATLARDGLVVKGALGEHRWPVRTRLSGDDLAGHAAAGSDGDYDLALLSCKAYDLDSAIAALDPAVGPRTLILPILNGLAHFERLDRAFGAERVLGGCCHLGGVLERDGAITLLTPIQRITYGLRAGSRDDAGDTVERLHAAYARTPVEARLAEPVLQDLWEKFVFLTTLAAVTCLMRASVGDIMATDEGEAIMLTALEECEAAAAHAGYPSRHAAFAATRAALTAPGSPSTASMLRDLEAGSRTESAHLVGDMLDRARRAGSDATVLRMAWAHLQARDRRLERERAR